MTSQNSQTQQNRKLAEWNSHYSLSENKNWQRKTQNLFFCLLRNYFIKSQILKNGLLYCKTLITLHTLMFWIFVIQTYHLNVNNSRNIYNTERKSEIKNTDLTGTLGNLPSLKLLMVPKCPLCLKKRNNLRNFSKCY